MTIRYWDIKNAVCLKILFFNHAVTSFTMSFSGSYLVAGTEIGDIVLWDLTCEEIINNFRIENIYNYNPIHSLDFSIDEAMLVVNSR